MIVRDALRDAAARLGSAGVPEPGGDARRLLAHTMAIPSGRLTLHMQDDLEAEVVAGFSTLVERRVRREPVSHLTGSRMFWGRDFRVTPDVLDPRPETEILVAVALEEPWRTVLDLGTGSGCLLVTLLAQRPEARGLGIDLSPAALEVAQTNAARHGVAPRATFAHSDWFAGARGRFDLIVSNPPYIAADEMAGLEPEVREREPLMALTDGGDGLAAYRAILAGARDHLAPGGRLLLEHGPTQAGAIAAMGRAVGLGLPEHRRDLDGRERACLFRAP